MRIRVKQKGAFADTKIDSIVKINEVLAKEDLIDQKKAHINIFFKGNDSSGIISIGKDEAKELVDSLSSFNKLPKEIKKI